MRQNHQKIYVLSGLGVDHRVFSSIDFGPFEVVHLPWLKPAHKETITAYAGRLSALITESAPVLIGLSFGGIMAQEIAKIIPCAKLVLLVPRQKQKWNYRLYTGLSARPGSIN